MSIATFTKEVSSISTPIVLGTNSASGAVLVDYARWIQVVGAGNVVAVNEDGSSTTFTCVGGEVLRGVFKQITSMSCTLVRYGNGIPPEPGEATPSGTSAAIGGVELSVAPANASVPVAVGVNDPAFANAGLGVFGDGSDGALHFDGSSVVLGLTPSSSVYTLTRDIFATNIIVDAGVTLNTASFHVFYSGTCTIAATGAISCDGKAAVTSTAGAATNTAGTLGIGTAGGAGGVGVNVGSAGTATSIGFPGATGAGGAGGAGGASGGGAAGAWTALAAVKGSARNLVSLITGAVFGTTTSGTANVTNVYGGGTGGGGGAGDDADATGGGGGGGGGVLILSGNTLVNNGSISCNGGAGAAGTSAAHNAGGGGGGGGGVVVVLYRQKSGAGTVTATGGAGGAKAGASGVVGSAGANGVVVQVAT